MKEIYYCMYEGQKILQDINIVSLRIVKDTSVPFCKDVISSSKDAYDLLKGLISDCDREMFVVCCLTVKYNPTMISVVSMGTLNYTVVHPREVFKLAVLSNASAIIVAHNHPSGTLTISTEDKSITDRLYNAGDLMGIKLLDHLIITSDGYISLKEDGYIT